VKSRQAEVVGAGLSGLVAATALAQRGWSVRVHELAPELRMFGAGIWLWENGLRVLDAIGAFEATIERVPKITDWERVDEKGRVLLRAEFNASDRLYIPPRAQLYEALIEAARAAGVTIETSSTVVSATPEGEIVTASGSRLSADLVVAADGHRSTVRESLGLTRRFQLKNEGCTRLLLPRSADDHPTRSTEYWNGHRRLLYCPSSEESIYVCLALPVTDTRGRCVPVDHKTWIESFPMLSNIIERIGEEGRWDVLSYVSCTSWSSGRVAIVGDAAHAQPPNLGQGANISFANVLGLAVALEEQADVIAALSTWEARERPLTDHTQRWSNIYGAVVEHWPAPLNDLRSLAVATVGRSRWLDRRLSKAARHPPTGTRAVAL
jgi:2-polyprenyl-6-methoxyphenol hydroxylase-like FAD-dependent oxidoreductase